jgi:hypothetical protein
MFPSQACLRQPTICRVLLLPTALAVPLVFALPECAQEVKVPAQVEKDLGKRTIAILSGATRVEVFRLGKQPLPKPKDNTIGLDGLQWPIKATGKEQGAAFAAKVRAFLFDEATRKPSGAGGARGWVAFRLWKDKESVTVVVDFEGMHLYIVTRDAEGKQIRTALGGFLFDAKGGIDKGGLFARIKALAREAFPNDTEIRALKKPEVEPLGP